MSTDYICNGKLFNSKIVYCQCINTINISMDVCIVNKCIHILLFVFKYFLNYKFIYKFYLH